ncbi:MAG TPA: 50S ribosomal protein L6, partial [Tepidisphaeraceae bacterium]|nr:50S ribosomal protein L6 [Tepidisphaeraceae bacterium]
MSRIGKKPVPVGAAKVAVADHHIKVEGPKGKLEIDVHPLISVKMDTEKKELLVTRPDDEKHSKSLHGLTRALLANMIEGVTNGYKKTLEIQGVGYKAEMKGKNLVLSVGYAN